MQLDRMSRGRHTYSPYGLSEDDDGDDDGDDNQATLSSDDDSDDSTGSSGDCDESDARLGLCGVHIPNPEEQQLKNKEAVISKQLDEKEAKSDEERHAIMLEINQKRLLKAKKLMSDLIDTDRRINDLVHHAVKVCLFMICCSHRFSLFLQVAAMATHTPSA